MLHVPSVKRCGSLAPISCTQMCDGIGAACVRNELFPTWNRSSCFLIDASLGGVSGVTYATALPSGRHENTSTPYFACVTGRASPPFIGITHTCGVLSSPAASRSEEH